MTNESSSRLAKARPRDPELLAFGHRRIASSWPPERSLDLDMLHAVTHGEARGRAVGKTFAAVVTAVQSIADGGAGDVVLAVRSWSLLEHVRAQIHKACALLGISLEAFPGDRFRIEGKGVLRVVAPGPGDDADSPPLLWVTMAGVDPDAIIPDLDPPTMQGGSSCP